MENLDTIGKIFGDDEVPKGYEDEESYLLNHEFLKKTVEIGVVEYDYYTFDKRFNDEINISVYITPLDNGYFFKQNTVACLSPVKTGWHVEYSISKWDPKYHSFQNENEFESLEDVLNAVVKGCDEI